MIEVSYRSDRSAEIALGKKAIENVIKKLKISKEIKLIITLDNGKLFGEIYPSEGLIFSLVLKDVTTTCKIREYLECCGLAQITHFDCHGYLGGKTSSAEELDKDKQICVEAMEVLITKISKAIGYSSIVASFSDNENYNVIKYIKLFKGVGEKFINSKTGNIIQLYQCNLK